MTHLCLCFGIQAGKKQRATVGYGEVCLQFLSPHVHGCRKPAYGHIASQVLAFVYTSFLHPLSVGGGEVVVGTIISPAQQHHGAYHLHSSSITVHITCTAIIERRTRNDLNLLFLQQQIAREDMQLTRLEHASLSCSDMRSDMTLQTGICSSRVGGGP